MYVLPMLHLFAWAALATIETPTASDTVAKLQADSSVAAVVSVWQGKCRYWTGDVGLSANQFRSILKERVQAQQSIVIFYGNDVAPKCVSKAQRFAWQAGFKQVRAELGHIDLSLPE